MHDLERMGPILYSSLTALVDFPDRSVGKQPACNAGDPSSIPGLGRSAGEGKGYPLQCSGLENSMDSIGCGVSKSRTRLSSLHFHCFGRKNMVCKPCLALSLNPSLSVNGDSFFFIRQLLADFLISLPLPSHQNTLLALPPWWCPESDHFSHPNPGHFHFLSWLVQEPLASLKLYFNTGIKVKSAVKNLPANARDMGSIPGLGRSPGEGNGSPLQYSCLGDPMDRGAWRATVHGVTKESDTTERLSNNLEILHQLRVWPRKFSLLSGPVPIPLALLTAPPLVLTEGATLSPPSP